MTVKTPKWLLIVFLLCVSVLPARQKVKTGPFTRELVLTGNLKAQKAETFIAPRTNTWQLEITWMIKEGTVVGPGDPVVRFKKGNLANEVMRLKNSLHVKIEQKKQKLAEREHKKFELEVQVKQAEIEFKKAKLDASLPRELTSDYDYEEKQLVLKKRAQDLEAARREEEMNLHTMGNDIKKLDIEIQVERDQLDNLLENLQKFTLKAQGSGAVMYELIPWEGRNVQVGDTVSSFQTVATIPDHDSLQVEAWVNETEINQVRQGQAVKLVLDAYPDREFTGVVQKVLTSAEERQQWGKNNYFSTLISINGGDPAVMKPGMSVQCTLQVEKIDRPLLIPLEKVYFNGPDCWVKTREKGLLKIDPLGRNPFYLAVSREGPLEDGDFLLTVEAGEIEEKGRE